MAKKTKKKFNWRAFHEAKEKELLPEKYKVEVLFSMVFLRSDRLEICIPLLEENKKTRPR